MNVTLLAYLETARLDSTEVIVFRPIPSFWRTRSAQPAPPPEPNPSFNFNADPDLDPILFFNADPNLDPAPQQSNAYMRPQ